jgi:hypothetical protein
VYVTAAPTPIQKFVWPSPPTGIAFALRAVAVVGTVYGDDTSAVHGPAGPVVEYAIVAVTGPLVVLQKAVELMDSAVKPTVDAQKATPSFDVLGSDRVPAADPLIVVKTVLVVSNQHFAWVVNAPDG